MFESKEAREKVISKMKDDLTNEFAEWSAYYRAKNKGKVSKKNKRD